MAWLRAQGLFLAATWAEIEQFASYNRFLRQALIFHHKVQTTGF